MPIFSVKLPVRDGGIYTFTLQHTFLAHGQRYVAFVKDRNNQLHRFSMEAVHGKWSMMDKEELPHWIVEKEAELIQAILYH